MKAKKPASGGNFERELIEEGTHIARIFMMVGCGTKYDARYDKTKDIIKFFVELPYETADFNGVEKPKVKTLDINNIISDRSGLTKLIKACGYEPEEFTDGDLELDELLWSVISVEIEHRTSKSSGNVYDNISSISKAKKSDVARCPELFKDNYERCIDLTDEDTTEEQIESVYPWVLKIALEDHEGLADRDLVEEVYERLVAEKQAAREAAQEDEDEAPRKPAKKAAKKPAKKVVEEVEPEEDEEEYEEVVVRKKKPAKKKVEVVEEEDFDDEDEDCPF